MSTGEVPWGAKQTQFFFELTPDRVLRAVERLGFVCTGRSMPLNSFENRVYQVEVEDEGPAESLVSHYGKKYVVIKFYRPGRWNREQIHEEHEFLRQLKDIEIPVVAPFLDQKNETNLSEDNTQIYFSCFPMVRGRSPDELSADQLEQVGRLLARIHSVGAIAPAHHRVHLTPSVYGLANLQSLLDNNTIPPEHREQYVFYVQEICKTTQPWFHRFPVQRIHGDCHLGNLLWGADGPFFLDFDDMVMGPPIQDLWLLIPGRDEEAKEKFEILCTGYEQMRPLDRKAFVLIEALRALRFVHFTAWIAKRWDDPAFPRAFPEFGTDKYWRTQVQDLRDQLGAILANGFDGTSL